MTPVPEDWIGAAAAQALAREPAGWSRPVLLVRVDQQCLYLWESGRVLARYPVSTAAAGVGSAEGSGRTPPGLHRVAGRIGDGMPVGTVFVGRVPSGERILPGAALTAASDADRITSRILWLEGLEPGVNRGPGVDSHDRYIYLHGTDREDLIGSPASHGCIRLRNEDMIALFAQVPDHSLVLVLPDATGT
jgi:hypothetical protein